MKKLIILIILIVSSFFVSCTKKNTETNNNQILKYTKGIGEIVSNNFSGELKAEFPNNNNSTLYYNKMPLITLKLSNDFEIKFLNQKTQKVSIIKKIKKQEMNSYLQNNFYLDLLSVNKNQGGI